MPHVSNDSIANEITAKDTDINETAANKTAAGEVQQASAEKPQLTAASFLTSVLKFSIATWINFLIYGVSLILITWLLPPSTLILTDIFLSTATLFMSITVLGLDQAFVRFFHEPPDGITSNKLLSACFLLSSGALVTAGLICTVFFSGPITAFFFNGGGPVPTNTLIMLFINAYALMIARYVNIAYRMEQNIKLYTIESILMQFFSRMFFLLGVFINNSFATIVVFNVIGISAFAAIFFGLRRKALLPQKGMFTKGIFKVVVPFGLALAPSAVLLWLNSLFSKLFILKNIGATEAGIFAMVAMVSNVIAVIQAGFSTYWSAFMFENYKTQQPKIIVVHDFLTFIILEFFVLIVAFEQVLFFVLGKSYYSGMQIFPILLLVPIFLIISETTVYGIGIAKRPIFDTLGILLSLAVNVGLCVFLGGRYGITGMALALAASSAAMFTMRTIIAQKFYKTMQSPAKTSLSILIAFALTACGYVFWNSFWIKGAICLAVALLYAVIYKKELFNCVSFLKTFIASLKNMVSGRKNAV